MVGAASPSIEPRRGRSRSADLARAVGAVLLGLCLHTFHTCGGADGGYELRDAHPLSGRCGGGAGDEYELLGRRQYLSLSLGSASSSLKAGL